MASWHEDRRDVRAEMEAELDALLARVATLTEALDVVEWNGYAYIGLEPCPACSNERTQGHAPDCIVGRALAGGDAAP